MADAKYSVSWDAYQTNICNGLSSLQQRGEFVDMTLAAEGHHVKVHQLVLSLLSPYIKDLITAAACPHPVIFLNKVSYKTLESLLQYAYNGEVLVPNDNIQEFLTTCKNLHVRGFESPESSEPRVAEESNNTPENTRIDVNTHFAPKKKDIDSLTGKSLILDTFGDPSGDCIKDNMCDNNDEELQTTVKSVEEQKQNVLESADKLKYTMSCMGTPQLVLNRYMYNIRSPRKNGECMWRCVHFQSKGCRAFIVVKGSKVLKRTCAHTHPFHDEQILKRLRNRNMFSTMGDVQRAIRKKKEEQARIENKRAKTKQQEVHSVFLFDAAGNDGETQKDQELEY